MALVVTAGAAGFYFYVTRRAESFLDCADNEVAYWQIDEIIILGPSQINLAFSYKYMVVCPTPD
jgi:hypothetical protein